MKSINQTITEMFSLDSGRATDQEIRAAIEDGADIRGANMVILMTAILIASIGLNMNSTAVVIGAMLISPLMGGIMAIGFGMATADLKLVRSAFAGLLVQVMICIFVSSLYFFLSPISTARSELLARTTPTIWDVLIALFGGLAGIIGVTRKERTNVIPGVAIATALMPPLCTVGFGVARGNFTFVLGAFYLFFINSFFICVSCFVVTRMMHIPKPGYLEESIAKRARRYFIAIGIVTVIPSIFLAWQIVAENTLNKNVKKYMTDELSFENATVVGSSLNKDKKLISVAIVGKRITDQEITHLDDRLKSYDLSGYKLKVTQAGTLSSLNQAEIQSIVEQKMQSAESQIMTGDANKEIEILKTELIDYKARLLKYAEGEYDTSSMVKELNAFYPSVKTLSLARTRQSAFGTGDKEDILVAVVGSSPALTNPELARIKVWLREKTGMETIQLYTRGAKLTKK